jgi:hypothetical protein
MNNSSITPQQSTEPSLQLNPASSLDPFAADEASLAELLNVPRWLPMPADPNEAAELRLKYMAKSQAIIEGWGANAPKLRCEPGDVFHLRFLRFGTDQRFISTISHHQLHRNADEVCPRKTDPALGGDPGAECPLCDAMGFLHRDLRPRMVTRYWVYAVVLAWPVSDQPASAYGLDGRAIPAKRRFILRNAEGIGRPHRICLTERAAIQLRAFAHHDPDIFDWGCGTDFELTINPGNYYQRLRRLRRGPVHLTDDPRCQERQRLAIESYLGEPHLYVPDNRIMDPEERRLRLLQADARLAAWDRLTQKTMVEGDPDDPADVARRRRRLDALIHEHHREYVELHLPGGDDASSTNPQPARNRAPHLHHRLQTLLQYRDRMDRSSEAFWTQFDPH